MNVRGRYDISGLVEAEFEPGSRGKVLRNLLGINRKREMDEVEAIALVRATEEAIRTRSIPTYDKDYRFIATDVCRIHKLWLGKIYEWAGCYRQVNVSKDGFPFAAASQVPRLMASFEDGPLRKYTPCCFDSKDEVVRAVAIVHTELVLIHPFREGNGRVARMLATLMAMQAGFPVLDFNGINKGRKRQEYFAAVRVGMASDYDPMERVFSAVFRRTLRNRG